MREPSSACPDMVSLSKNSVCNLFKWLIAAENVAEVDVRCDWLAHELPVLEHVFARLKRLKEYWALVYHTWCSTFGLQASALIESVWWSYKSFMGRKVHILKFSYVTPPFAN